MRPGGQVRFLETHGNSVRLGRSALQLCRPIMLYWVRPLYDKLHFAQLIQYEGLSLVG